MWAARANSRRANSKKSLGAAGSKHSRQFLGHRRPLAGKPRLGRLLALRPSFHCREPSFGGASRAYERQSLIITTNLPFEQWAEVCGSERLTGAMLDRLTHRVHIVEANGESYRLRDSQRRIKRKRIESTEN